MLYEKEWSRDLSASTNRKVRIDENIDENSVLVEGGSVAEGSKLKTEHLAKCLFSVNYVRINPLRERARSDVQFISAWKSSAYRAFEETGRAIAEEPREKSLRQMHTRCCFHVENFLSADKGNRETRSEC